MTESTNDEKAGSLVRLMQTSTANIKKERANQVLTNIHTTFKQRVDASYNKIEELNARKTEMLYKLIPNTTIQTDFEVDPADFVNKRLNILKELVNEKIWFEALTKEYFELFGKNYTKPETFL